MELLERDTQLAALNTALSEVRAGFGRIALVSGEAGIGKTSLVEQFTRHPQRYRANPVGQLAILSSHPVH